jgi:glycosyltransferase involved in cell wall biosynthesis
MRVLHVSTYKTGGAGIAAYRLHKGLLQLGVSSEFICLDNGTALITKKPIHKVLPRQSILKRLIVKIYRSFLPLTSKRIETQETNDELIIWKYEAFTSPISDFDLTLHPAYLAADVIHLHWVSEFLDYPTFFSKNTKPVVWTIHDMNPFKGGFHYEGDVLSNKQLAVIDSKYLDIKFNALLEVQNLKVIALSKWMLNLSVKSKVLSKFSHFLIPNGLDTDIFKPLPKDFCRDVLLLPKGKKIVLFVSEKLNIHRKGFDLLLDVVQQFYDQEDILFCALGANKGAFHKNLLYLGEIQEERLLAVLYAACDVFLIPSREDNLPNVILEALACGTPVVATPVGGIPDIVINGLNGVLANDTSADGLYQALLHFFKNITIYSSEKIRHDFVAKYTMKDHATAILSLYRK